MVIKNNNSCIAYWSHKSNNAVTTRANVKY